MGTTIQERALKWVRRSANKKKIIKKIVEVDEQDKSTVPEVLFMAGSPGAGKTEISKNLNQFVQNDFEISKYARIDADELRGFLEGYDGKNAHLFQNHVSILMDDCISFVAKNKINAIVDGTLSNYGKTVKNIEKFKKAGYRIGLVYVYQEPEIAWRFTQAREKTEGRRIRKADFISSFFAAHSNVSSLKLDYGSSIEVIAVKKNLMNDDVEDFKVGVVDLEEYVKITCTRSELEEMLNEEEFKEEA